MTLSHSFRFVSRLGYLENEQRERDMNDDNNDNGNGYKQTVHKEMEYKAWNTYEIELYDCEQPPAITTHTPTAKHSNNDDSHSHRTSVFFPLSLSMSLSVFVCYCMSF